MKMNKINLSELSWCDANSSVVFTSATSWVKSLGYQCVVKPDSWASSWLADAYAK